MLEISKQKHSGRKIYFSLPIFFDIFAKSIDNANTSLYDVYR